MPTYCCSSHFEELNDNIQICIQILQIQSLLLQSRFLVLTLASFLVFFPANSPFSQTTLLFSIPILILSMSTSPRLVSLNPCHSLLIVSIFHPIPHLSLFSICFLPPFSFPQFTPALHFPRLLSSSLPPPLPPQAHTHAAKSKSIKQMVFLFSLPIIMSVTAFMMDLKSLH